MRQSKANNKGQRLKNPLEAEGHCLETESFESFKFGSIVTSF